MAQMTISLDEWLTTPLGQHLLARESAYFDTVVADMFGFNAVQIGHPELDLLRNCRIPKRYRVGYDGVVALRADVELLPFASQSMDLVVIPHTLEFAANPHQVLREVERILMPEGHLIVSGFNPRSLWGRQPLDQTERGRISVAWSFYHVAASQRLVILAGF